MYTYSVHDTITGVKLGDIHMEKSKWTRRLNGRGTGTHSLLLRDKTYGIGREDARELFQTNGRTIVARWDGIPMYAGLITGIHYQRPATRLTFSTRELRAIWDTRMTFGVANYADGNLTVTNRDESGAVAAILARGTAWGGVWNLPVDLPPSSIGTFGADWKNYQCLTIEDLLGQVEARGFEVDHPPYFAANDSLRWGTRVASPIVGGQVDLPVSTVASQVTDLKVTLDGDRQLSGSFYLGNGTETDMTTGFAYAIAGPTIPVRDSLRTAKDVRSVSELNKLAMADLVANRSPIEQWSLNVTIDNDVTPLHLRPGEILNLDIRGDAWLPDAKHRVRVIALTSDGSAKHTPEVQIYGS